MSMLCINMLLLSLPHKNSSIIVKECIRKFFLKGFVLVSIKAIRLNDIMIINKIINL